MNAPSFASDKSDSGLENPSRLNTLGSWPRHQLELPSYASDKSDSVQDSKLGLKYGLDKPSKLNTRGGDILDKYFLVS